MLKIENNKLVLSPELIMLLQAVPGDKISIEYSVIDNKLYPVILKGEKGNVLTKSNTVAFKGKQKESLLQFGDVFTLDTNLIDGNIALIGNKGNVVYTAVPKTILEDPLDKNIILDTNYNIKKFDIYEL